MPNQFKQTPGRALLAFGVTAALVAVFTVVDARRRTELEGYDFPTALGDSDRFEFEETFDPNQPVMEFGGKPLYRQRRDLRGRFGGFMFKVGREDGDRCFLYRYSPGKSGEISPEGIYFAKVGEGSYVELGEEPRRIGAETDEDAPTEADQSSDN